MPPGGTSDAMAVIDNHWEIKIMMIGGTAHFSVAVLLWRTCRHCFSVIVSHTPTVAFVRGKGTRYRALAWS